MWFKFEFTEDTNFQLFSGECIYSKMYAYRHADTAHIPHEYVGLTQAYPNNNVIQEAYPCNSRQ